MFHTAEGFLVPNKEMQEEEPENIVEDFSEISKTALFAI